MNSLTWRKAINTLYGNTPRIHRRGDGLTPYTVNTTELRAYATHLRSITAWFRQNPKRYGKFDPTLTRARFTQARDYSRELGVKLDRDAVRNLSADETYMIHQNLGMLDIEAMNMDTKMLFRIFDKVADMCDTFADNCTRNDWQQNDILWQTLVRKKFASQIKDSGWKPKSKTATTSSK